ncbi:MULTISPECIES: hypothetical protein [Xanthomonas]|uniref:hypothetical protein n=1 Tax=Xanthomonas TaxID=338 RepID=UPI000E1F41BC|nr:MULTISPECIES: hypothetical protein [Xanthomonas]
MIPEQVFAELWEKQMVGYDEEGDPVFVRFTGNIPPTQELAFLAASFVTWLGTSVGGGFLDKCRKMAKIMSSTWHHDAYLAAWAIENRLLVGHRYNWRMIELLAWDGDWNAINRHSPPELPAAAYEVVENLVCWLGGDAGQKFVTLCEATIHSRQLGLRPADIAALGPLIDHLAKQEMRNGRP